MSYLTIFNIVAGIASILAFFAVVIGWARKTLRTYEQKRQGAEQELEKELARLKAAGETVSARSDLGFLILIELGSLHDSVSQHRHNRTSFQVFAVIALLIFAMFKFFTTSGGAAQTTFMGVIGILAVASLMISFMEHFAMIRLRRYTDAYERRIKEVWARPVYRRSDTDG